MPKISFLKFDKGFTGHLEALNHHIDAYSKYAVNVQGSTACASNLYKALKIYLGLEDGEYFVGKTAENGGICVRRLSNGEYEVVAVLPRPTFANQFDVYGGNFTITDDGEWIHCGNYVVREGGRNGCDGVNGTGALIALLPHVFTDEEARRCLLILRECIALDPEDDAWTVGDNLIDFKQNYAILGDNIYRRIQNAESSGNPYFSDSISIASKNSDIKKISNSLMQNFLNTAIERVSGTPMAGFTNVSNYANPANISAPTPTSVAEKVANWCKKFRFTPDHDYSEEEKEIIPVMSERYVWADWLIRLASLIKASTKYSEPLRTVYLVGSSGAGKSLASSALAQLLNLPKVHQTCSADMEIFDFIGQLYPNVNPSAKVDMEEVRKSMGLPSVEDIMADNAGSYQKIFGRNYDGLTSEADIIAEMVKRVMAEVAARTDNARDYTFVEGTFTKAVRYGWLDEVQEIGAVHRESVAVGLNGILEAEQHASMVLPTGEVLYRNPNTVFVFTSNDGYKGTRPLNPSVLSRLRHVEYFRNPTPAEMAKRAKAVITDFADDNMLMKMAECIKAINDYCEEESISSGIVAQRELTAWAMEAQLMAEMAGIPKPTNDMLRETCQHTVLNKASQDIDDIIKISAATADITFGSYEPLTNY